MTLEEFLKLEQPEDFDFKDCMEEHYTNIWLNLQRDLRKMRSTSDMIMKWYLYRTADQELNRPFDCDRCMLAEEIYQILWGNLGKKLTPDTMNSFAYTFGHSVEGSYRSAYRKYLKGAAELSIFSQFAQRTGCVGNFVLVPSGYNRYRGSVKNSFKDYWDLSLHNLKYNQDKSNWLENADLSFEKYINLFFLWDNVQLENNEYQVKPLFQRKYALDTSNIAYPYKDVFPEGPETAVFLQNVNTNIEKRGKFMVDMLRIAMVDPVRYREIQTYLSESDVRFTSSDDAAKQLKEKYPAH